MRHLSTALLLSLALLASRASALTIGDPAPALTVATWVKGEPVKALEKDKLYVVEFWATWCGPCRTSIPHLTELAHKHKDVTFLGISVSEPDDAAVAPFVKEMGDKMDYRVATDDKSKDPAGAMSKNWMEAAAQNGIPTAFIVGKDSTILWIGHPMTMEKPLEEIVAGTYDVKAAKAQLETAQKAAAAEMNFNKVVSEKVGPAVNAKDYDAAFKALDELAVEYPGKVNDLLFARFSIAANAKRWDDLYATADKLVSAADAPFIPNQLAWVITTRAEIEKKDLDRALKYATRAVELSKSEDAAILDTLARVHFEKGDKAKAREVQEQAVGKATGNLKAALEKNLEKYK